MTDAERDPLAKALAPRSVAVIGASDEADKIGGRGIMFMQRHGYRGEIYPINPKRATVQGLRAYASLADLPEPPELAVIAVPGAAAVAAVEACAAAGVAACLVLSSGFAEIGGEGAAAQARMVAAARASGMRMMGPNSQGLANFATGAVTAFSTMFLEYPPQDGPVGIVSQSGGMAAVIYAATHRQGLGVRYMNATGNDADVTAPELAVAMARDPDLRLLLLYVESVRDGAALAELGRIARARALPVLLLKGGSTDLGQAAAASHTAALANDDRVLDAFLAAHGIWRARDQTELMQAASLYVGGTQPAGPRTVSISNSGAACVLAADAVAREGLTLATLSAETKAAAAAVLPGFASVANPIDLTAALLGNSHMFGDLLPLVGADPAADSFVISLPVVGQGYDVEQFGRDAAAFAAQTGKPVLVAANQPRIAAIFAGHGLPTFDYEHQAFAALAQVVRHAALLAAPAPPPRVADAGAAGSAATLSEVESLERLAARGVAVPPWRLVRSAGEAAAAFAALGGGAAVLKGSSRAAPHKSELGLVRLGLRDEAAVRRAWDEVAASFAAHGLPSEGAIVAGMAKGRVELLIGARRDPVFGTVLTFGAGGKYVEALADVALLVPPVTRASLDAALDGLRIGPVLRGIRGEAAVDLDALAAMLAAVAAMVDDPTERIDSIDINPVFAGDEGLAIADALIVVREG